MNLALLLLDQIIKSTTRIPSTVADLPIHYFTENRLVKANVLKVNDADGVRVSLIEPTLYTLFPTITRKKKGLSIRLAGIDAPELARFGFTDQPHAKEALAFLKEVILDNNNIVYIRLLAIDHYNRALGMVYLSPRQTAESNTSLLLVENGLAVVYRGKNSQYGDCLEQLEKAENKAKKMQLGIWKKPTLEKAYFEQ